MQSQSVHGRQFKDYLEIKMVGAKQKRGKVCVRAVGHIQDNGKDKHHHIALLQDWENIREVRAKKNEGHLITV